MKRPLLHPSYFRWLERLLARAHPASAKALAFAPPESAAELEQIARRALRSSGDPWLGLSLGEAIPVLGHGPLSALLASAATMRSALEDLERYASLRAPVLRFALRVRPRGAVLELCPNMAGAELAERILIQAVAVLLERLFEALLGEVPRGLRHGFPWPAESEAPYRRRLRGAIRFGAPLYALELPSELLTTPLPGADPEAARNARRLCEALLARSGIAERPMSAAIERLLWQAEWRWPALPELAAALSTSVRSLQRALAEEGTSFRALRERVRAERARRLLAESELPIGQIAERLGYRDPGNFARSLRRWLGDSGRKLRARLQAARPS